MSALKYLVPALAIAGKAAAQCSAATQTIASSADAAALSTCTTFTGSIAIATGTTDNIVLNGIQEITGSLIADNVTLITEISAPSLITIGNTFNLDGLTVLSTLSFPRLTNVEAIQWTALPALQGLSFTTGVQTASTLDIENTELNSLDGIDLETIETLYIANNPYLQSIDMQLGNVSDALTIEANGDNLTVTFPNMIWSNNMTFRNVSSLSIPSLEAVNGSMGFYSNNMASISAANLTTVGGSLSFVLNEELTNISMPVLTTIGGGFQIANNTILNVVNGFPDLKTIGGAISFTGNFTEVVLPALADVKGAFSLVSSQSITANCSTFKAESGTNAVIKGKYNCVSGTSTSSGSSSSSSSSSSSTSSSSTAKSDASSMLPAAASGFMGLLAVMFGML